MALQPGLNSLPLAATSRTSRLPLLLLLILLTGLDNSAFQEAARDSQPSRQVVSFTVAPLILWRYSLKRQAETLYFRGQCRLGGKLGFQLTSAARCRLQVADSILPL